MLGLDVVVVLGVAVLAGRVLGRRLRVAPPVLLLAIGVLLGFVPVSREVHLPPEVMLLLFLLSTMLVIITAAAVAAAAHALGVPWGPAWVLGAAVAPTDATAVSMLAGALPRRTITVLRAESLVNDGTALVIYGLALGVTVGDDYVSPLRVSGLFLLSYGGGALAGAVVAWFAIQVRRRLDGPLHDNVAVLLTPFAAFLLADAVGASGVLAVVVCGLIMSQAAPRLAHAESRQQTTAFWSLATFLLNGAGSPGSGARCRWPWRSPCARR